MNPVEYDVFDALGLAELVASKEVHPSELLDAAIARVENLNPALNAVVNKMYDQARTRIAQGLPDGPFKGVPFLLKDLSVHYKGTVTSSGSRSCAHMVADHHSTLTERYLAAGLVVFGKTNTPEFGLSGTTESMALGPCHNPWDPARGSGGSSGGAAVAVATGMVPMAHASDAGGSIRNPASQCGVFGLKPTRARTPLGPMVFEGSGGLSAHHAVTISVRDSAALLDATAGPAPGDAYVAPRNKVSFATSAGQPPKRLRIAFHLSAHHDVAIHPECQQATLDAAKLCENLGHIVEDARPAIDGEQEMAVNRILWSANLANTSQGLHAAQGLALNGQGLEANTWELIQLGQQVSAVEYIRAIQSMHRTSRDIAGFFDTYDIVLSPVLSQPPWLLDTYEKSYADAQSYYRKVFDYSPFCWPYNMTGQPAMSVPLHRTPAGLPVGVQFVARFGDEATLFQLAAQLEQAQRWATPYAMIKDHV